MAEAAPGITDLQIVDAMVALHDGGLATFDGGMTPSENGAIYWALKRFPETDLILFRGSQDATDWLRDLMALPVRPQRHPQLGVVHAGFLIGMEGTFAAIAPLLRRPFIVAGHSLGAAHACLFAGLWLTQRTIGTPTLQRIMLCGCPNPADATLKSLLAPLPIISYRNRRDPICEVPPAPFVRVREFTAIDGKPPLGDGLGVLDHPIHRYQAGLRAFFGPRVPRRAAA